MKVFYVLIVSLLILSCNKKILLSHTKWEYKYDNSVSDTLIFINDTNYKFYDTALENISIGIYQLADDILYLTESDTIENTVTYRRYTFSIGEEKLYPKKLEEKINDNWVESNFKFDSSYVFILAKNNSK